MKLTPRLQVIADYVEKDAIVADIGTDHAYIPVHLLENDISKKVIAADINKGPLNNAKKYIESRKLEDKIETRLGNGIEVLKPYEVNTVIIAGMGGLLINGILENSKAVVKTIDTFILQPMVASDELRKYLYTHGYKITHEKLAKEGNKLYEIIYAEHGNEDIENEIYYEIGKKLFENKDEFLEEFLDKKTKKLEKAIDNIAKSSTQEGKERSQQLKEKYVKLREMKERL